MSTAKTPKPTTAPKGRGRQGGPTDPEPKAAPDVEDDVEIVEPTFAPMVPIPAFMAATLMEEYESEPMELCWQAIESIRNRASADENAVDASRLAEAASYVPRWLFSTAINLRLSDESFAPFGVENRSARHLRMDEWTQAIHRRYLAVRARSIIGADATTGSSSGTEDVIRNLSSILERQVAAVGASPQPERSPFDSFPPTTRQLVLFASELTPDGMVPTRPTRSFLEVLALTNVAFMQNHMHNFLRHSKSLDVQIASGVCAAIRTGTFTSGATDRPGAFSLFCCGPQVIEAATSDGKDANEQTNSLIQMQLKTTDTTTGLSDKDIKNIAKFGFTIPRDFFELARLMQNMAGVTELLFGFNARLTVMLDNWHQFLTRAPGSTIPTLRQLAQAEPSAACQLGWFIDRRMQQFLVLCASGRHDDVINSTLLDFGTTRQQLEDGAFEYKLSEYLRDRVGRRGTAAPAAAAASSGSATRAATRASKSADATINPQKGVFETTSNDTWQVFIDHAGSAPIPNMCCRWHLNGKCVKNCFNAASHIQLDDTQIDAVKAWIEKCRARMPRNSSDARTAKKQKLGHSDSAYTRFNFVAMSSLPGRRAPDLPIGAPVAHSSVAPVVIHARRGTPHPLDRPPTVSSEGDPRPTLAPQSPPPGSASVKFAPTLETVMDSPTAAAPTRRRLTPSVRSIPTTTAIDSGPDEGRSPHDATSTRTTVPFESIARKPPPQTTLPPPDDASPPPFTTSGKSSFVPLPSLPFPSPLAAFPPLPTPRLADALEAILAYRHPPTRPSEFRFEWSADAAVHNWDLLRRHDRDLGSALRAQPFSTLTFGSEFRPAHLLAPLLSLHPLWGRFVERITDGAAFPLHDISDDDRLSAVHANLARGNHKSAHNHEQSLISMLREEVERGWQLPLPKEAALEIPGCEVAPLGMVVQTSIDEKGEPQRKLRLTHDQSFNPKGSSGRSVNDRVDETTLTPARFGRAFSRFLYHVSYLRKVKSDEPIYLTKVDFKSAYRRIHLQASTAVKACTCIDGFLLVALRLTFGGSPNPSLWSDVSEVVTDLANDLVRRPDWDPKRHHSPHQSLLESDRAKDDDADGSRVGEGFGRSHFFAPDYPIEDVLPRFDCYLDDIFGAFFSCDKAKSEAAIPLALHLVGRPNDTSNGESFPRDDLLSLSKFLAEAKPSQRKTILGWLVDTRAFVVKLSAEKLESWSRSIDDLIHCGRRPVQAKDLSPLLGRLNNASYVIPYARHFTGRLYKALARAEAKGAFILSGPQLDDLVLWKRFLQYAAGGISINRLVCRWPTRIVRVDACPQGMGGYCLQSGIAWRYQLPESLLGRATLNALEFLAAFVGVLVEFGCGEKWTDVDVVLSQGDSVSAARWLASSSFDDNCPMHLAIARSFADFCLGNGIDHYSQWFPGKENTVADVLSRDFALSDEDVTKLIRRHCSPLVPQSFRIMPLPGTIISRIGELLRRLPSTELLPTQPTPSATAVGDAMNASSDASGDDLTLFSDSSDDGRDSKPLPASPPLLEKDDWTPEELQRIALEPRPELFVPPSTVWLRPIGSTNLRAPSTTGTDDLTQFWSSSSEDMRTRTPG